MKVKASNCREMTDKAIDSINESIKLAREKCFTLEQLNVVNSGNLVQIMSAIANSLASIADSLKKGDDNDG